MYSNKRKIGNYFHPYILKETESIKKFLNYIEGACNFPGVLWFIIIKSDVICRVSIFHDIQVLYNLPLEYPVCQIGNECIHSMLECTRIHARFKCRAGTGTHAESLSTYILALAYIYRSYLFLSDLS